MKTFIRLTDSRKVQSALIGILSVLILYLQGAVTSEELITRIVQVVMLLIGAIALENAGQFLGAPDPGLAASSGPAWKLLSMIMNSRKVQIAAGGIVVVVVAYVGSAITADQLSANILHILMTLIGGTAVEDFARKYSFGRNQWETTVQVENTYNSPPSRPKAREN